VRFGVGMDPIEPPAEVLDSARLAERLGYESFWVADSQLLMRDAFVLMGLVCRETGLIVGSGVTNFVTRHPSVIARAYSTLEELAPGRVVLGAGVGDSALRLIGRRPSTVAQVEQAIGHIRTLLRGDDVEYDGAGPVVLRDAVPVPIYLAATGPRMLALAGRAADGVLLGYLTDTEQLEAARAIVESEARRAGRDLAGFRYVAWIPCCVDADSAHAAEQVSVHVARHVLHTFPVAPTEDPAVAARLHDAYDYREHMRPGARHAEHVPRELVARHALAGTPDEVAERLEALILPWIDHVVIVPRGDKARILTAFAEEVAPRFSGGPARAPLLGQGARLGP
jgi:5,10-methylenetetrahydromethanopterin reductase